ncbi:MAG: hypothetical protein R3Y05_03410 [bacterium]
MQVCIREIKSSKKLNEQETKSYILTKYFLDKVEDFKLIKRSIDSRNKPKIFYIYSVVFKVDKLNKALLNEKNLTQHYEYTDEYKLPFVKRPSKTVVVGFGPSGMFAALLLARSGFKPIIVERGKEVDGRTKDIEEFFKTDKLNTNSNVVFGEGGAGTFSDGKLTTNLKDSKIRFILKEFIAHGAKRDIYYDGNPHIGTDYLVHVVKRIREEIIELGGTFMFSHTLTNFDYNKQYDLTLLNTINNKEVKLTCDKLILGVGHSSNETYELLYKKNVYLEPKPFSMGVRIEHPQSLINKVQFANEKIKEAAVYKLNVKACNRDIYTFCMCPGGMVVSSNNEENTIVTNGMSYNKRDLENANSGLLVNVKVEDFFVNSPLDGLEYRRKYEKLCYDYSNSYKAPINLVKEFLNDEVATKLRSVKPSYPNGYVFANMKELLPDFVYEALKEGIKLMDKRLRGFNFNDAVITAVETRSSSVIRIKRDENYQANIPHLYPIGEGAGYSGGITSSCLDGINVATYIINEEF